MGVVKYSGPIASFHCPTNAEIRSLKVHFSPKQLGEGTPSPENVREIVGWDGVVVHNEADYVPIPEEYQRVEWIKSTGTQYIDTNILFNHGIKISARMGFAAKESSRTLFGVRVDTGATRFLVTYYKGFDFAYWNDTIPFEPEIDYIYDITFDTSVSEKFTYGAGGRLWTANVTEIFPNLTGYIFAYHRGSDDSVQGISKSYFQSMNIENASGDALFNGYACYCKSDNVAGIYDTVTQTFFTNQGTGEFICGPDVGETTDYEFGVLGKNKFNNAAPYKPIEGAENKIQNKEDLLAGLAAGQMIFYGLSHGGSIDEEILYNINNQVNIVMKVAPNTTYCFSGSIDGGARTECFIKGFSYFDVNFIKLSTGTQTNGVFTVPNDSQIKYICVYVHNYAQSSSQNPWSISDVLNSLQIELGSTATTYEPYDPNHTVYGGWVDLITGEVQEDGINRYPYRSIILNGTEEWTLVTQNDEASIFKYYYGVSAKTEANSICSHFKIQLASYKSLNCHNGFVHGMSGNLFIQPINSIASTVEEFQAYLASQYQNGTPVTVLFQANEASNTYSLAPTQLQTFLGQNNVWSNADYVEVEYDLHETQDILARKQFIIANQPHIVKPAAAPIQTFTTDLAAPLKECKIHFSPVQEGTGDPSPENVRPINGWNSIQVGLPSEYQAVEYLEKSHNTSAYIDTGIVPDETTIFTGELSQQYAPSRRFGNYFGARSTIGTRSNWFVSDGSGDGDAYFWYNNTYVISDILRSGNKCKIQYTSSGGFIEDLVTGDKDIMSYQCTSYPPYSIFIFARNQDGDITGTYGPVRCYSATIEKQNSIVRYFIPCVRKSDNKPGMYDTVSKTFYTNAGTGEFICGPDVEEQSLLIDWTNEAGTVYGGYVNLVSGEVWKTYHKITLDGVSSGCKVNHDYSNDTYIIGGVVYLSPVGASDYYSGHRSTLYCNNAPLIGRGDNSLDTFPFIRTVSTGKQYLRIYLAYAADHSDLDTEQKRIDFCNAYLTENPIDIVYPLQTPTLLTTLTPTQLKTLRGTNNIWSNANGNIELAYWSH